MQPPRDLLVAVVVACAAGCGGWGGQGGGDGGGDDHRPDGSPPDEACPGEIGVICTVAGDGESALAGDGGPARDASLGLPVDVSFGLDGTAYVVDFNNGAIRMIDPDSGVISRFAGTGDLGLEGCETELGADVRDVCLNHPTAIALDGEGQAFIAAWFNSRVLRVDVAGRTITAVLGDGRRSYAGDGGPASSASFDTPSSVVPDGAGGLYLMDQHNQVVRFVDRTGVVDRHAGRCVVEYPEPCAPGQEPVGCPGIDKLTCGAPAETCLIPCSPGFADGTRLEMRMAQSFGAGSAPNGQLALDPAGGLYVSDAGNRRVRLIRADGTVATVAGTGEEGSGGDGGPATEAELVAPADIALAGGALFIADPWAQCVRRVSPGGIIDTVAGVCGAERGFAGDGGPATEALLKMPFGVAVHRGVLYIADTGNNRIRAVRLE